MYAIAGEASQLVLYVGIVDADDRGFISAIGVGPEFFQRRSGRSVDETVSSAPTPLVDYFVAFGTVSGCHPRDLIISYGSTMVPTSLLPYASLAGFDGILSH